VTGAAIKKRQTKRNIPPTTLPAMAAVLDELDYKISDSWVMMSRDKKTHGELEPGDCVVDEVG
jgi:hypothetical protein